MSKTRSTKPKFHNKREGRRPRRGAERPPRERGEKRTHSAIAYEGISCDSVRSWLFSTPKKLSTAPHIGEGKADYREWQVKSYEGTGREANGYIMSRDTTTREVYETAECLLDGFHDHSKHFFHHVAASGTRRGWELDRWVPMYHGLWYGKLPHANPDALVEAGLLEKREHTFAVGGDRRSAEYRIAPNVQAWLDEVLFLSLDGGAWFNRFTGSTTTRKAKTHVTDENNHRYPDPVVKGMKGIETVKVNRAGGRTFVAKRRRAYKDAQESFYELSGLTFVEASKRVNEARNEGWPMPIDGAEWKAYRETEKAHSRYTVDLAALLGIARQVKEDLGGGIVECYAAYEPQSTGRITDKGILAQSASRGMKAALFAIPNVFNYDMVSSQPRMLRVWFERYDLPIDPLHDLLETNKHEHAAHVGLTVDGWKRAIMALIMSAVLFRSLQTGTKRGGTFRGDLPRIIAENAIGDPAQAYKVFRSYVQPLHKQLERWRRYLVEEWIPEHVQYNSKGRFVKNAAGMLFYLDERKNGEVKPKSVRELKRKLPAFLLQGQESFFIHTLVALAPDYGFRPMANEHDGLITEGRIPEAAIEAAKRVTGMSYVDLVLKDLA